jgi:hypothetical protein
MCYGSGADWPDALLQLDLPVGHWFGRTKPSGGIGMASRSMAASMAWLVAAAVGAIGQALAELLDLADVGLALVGVRGEGCQGRHEPSHTGAQYGRA